MNAPACLTLKFFEFIDSIRTIGTNAFRAIPLNMSTIYLPANLYKLEAKAFLQSFKNDVPITIIVGSELKSMGWITFANSYNIPVGSTVIIGSAENKSKFDLNARFNSLFLITKSTQSFFLQIYAPLPKAEWHFSTATMPLIFEILIISFWLSLFLQAIHVLSCFVCITAPSHQYHQRSRHLK